MNFRSRGNARLIVPLTLIALVLVLLLAISDWPSKDEQARYFEDVTVSSGLNFRGMTFGAAWGDFDADGLPDVYVTNHINKGALLRNVGEGHFENVTSEYLPAEPAEADKHGALWADFDSDGDLDLLVLRGGKRGIGAEANLLYVNEGGTFADRAAQVGLANPEARTRMPLWVDIDGDGRLDLFMGALKRKDGKAPATVYLQDGGRFAENPGLDLFATDSVSFCILGGVDQDRSADLVCRVHEVEGQTVQILSTGEFPPVELEPFPATHFNDAVAADFDGDAQLDLYLARAAPSWAPVLLGSRGSNALLADLWISSESVRDDLGFTFDSAGQLSIQIIDAYPGNAVGPKQVEIGAHALQPDDLEFTLSPEVAGIDRSPDFVPGDEVGVFLGRNADGQWEVRASSRVDLIEADREKHQQITIHIESTDPISDARGIGMVGKKVVASDRLYMNRTAGLSEESADRGVNELLTDSVNVAAADFDNDMDIDLYLVASGPLANPENRLLLNQGDGTFRAVAGGGGASGGRSGVGDSVTVADFDRDGFLDLLVSNGGSMGRSFGVPAEDGDYRLYRNTSNENNWLEIDLEGVKSNRDGIGAFVYVTAGGKRQVRLQDGGVHHRGQNHQRLHFGLAGHSTVDEIEVHWPSGTVQRLFGIAANQVLTIKES